ncbi:MAG: hypothetical protein MZU84_01310 [Sphingobacterium sp.]|nr:hypothetical protein [Sphingobacterium sp.]
MVDGIDYWGYLVAENQHSEKAAPVEVPERREPDPVHRGPGRRIPTIWIASLFNWLNRISLITRDDLDEEEDAGKVNLMTVHASKGLEFEVVFIAGCEDGIMPHARALGGRGGQPGGGAAALLRGRHPGPPEALHLSLSPAPPPGPARGLRTLSLPGRNPPAPGDVLRGAGGDRGGRGRRIRGPPEDVGGGSGRWAVSSESDMRDCSG